MSLPAFLAFDLARAKHAELLREASCRRRIEQTRPVHPRTEERGRPS